MNSMTKIMLYAVMFMTGAALAIYEFGWGGAGLTLLFFFQPPTRGIKPDQSTQNPSG